MIQKGNKHEWARGMVALLIILIAFGIFLLFYNQQDTILQDSFYPFMTATVIGVGFLFGLLYLVNKPHKVHKVHHKATKSVKKSPKKKK